MRYFPSQPARRVLRTPAWPQQWLFWPRWGLSNGGQDPSQGQSDRSEFSSAYWKPREESQARDLMMSLSWHSRRDQVTRAESAFEQVVPKPARLSWARSKSRCPTSFLWKAEEHSDKA